MLPVAALPAHSLHGSLPTAATTVIIYLWFVLCADAWHILAHAAVLPAVGSSMHRIHVPHEFDE